MRVCGIIAEYNPFHSGHAYQLRQAKAISGCDYVIVAMSGDFVQRGAPALLDKYVRARMALLHGADLVLMLPVAGSCSSAQEFARSGVAALRSTGVVDTISFGCEDLSICSDSFQSLARAMNTETPKFQKTLQNALAKGLSYGSARMSALQACCGSLADLSLLNQPNNMLAFEYMRAIAEFGDSFALAPILRRGEHHETEASDTLNKASYYSAGRIRRLLLDGYADAIDMLRADGQLPMECADLLSAYGRDYAFLSTQDFSAQLHYALLSQSKKGYAGYTDVGCDLSGRIERFLGEYTDFESFCDLLKNKSLSRARICRALIHILLQIQTKPDVPLLNASGHLPYLRVLGLRRSAQPLLHAIKTDAAAPLITRAAKGADATERGAHYFSQDILSCELYRSALLQKSGHCYDSDYKRCIQTIE